MSKKKNDSAANFIPSDNNLNAATDPWIPVRKVDGTIEKVSLIDVFSNEYCSFAGDAVEQYCLMRLCEAIAHSPEDNQPESVNELVAIKETFATKAVEYLNKNINLFYFRGNIPFLQCSIKEIEEQYNNLGQSFGSKPIQLREEYAVGNNKYIIQSTKKEYTTAAEILLDILIHQIFEITLRHTKSIPSRILLYSNLHAGNLNIFLKSNNLINSIWSNMTYSQNWGHTIFERNTDTSTYLNRLVPQTVFVNISENLREMYYTKGLDYLDLETDNSHIAYTKYIKKNGKKEIEEFRPIKSNENFKYWESFASMIIEGTYPSQLKRMDIRFKNINVIEITALGKFFKFNVGLYTNKFFISSRFIKHPAKLETHEYKEFIKSIVEISSKAKKTVNFTIYSLSKQIEEKSKADSIINQVNSIFWDYLDINSQIIFGSEGLEEDINKWKEIITSAINRCYVYLIENTMLTIAYRFKTKVSYSLFN